MCIYTHKDMYMYMFVYLFLLDKCFIKRIAWFKVSHIHP